jgi:hypothetical protein
MKDLDEGQEDWANTARNTALGKVRPGSAVDFGYPPWEQATMALTSVGQPKSDAWLRMG